MFNRIIKCRLPTYFLVGNLFIIFTINNSNIIMDLYICYKKHYLHYPQKIIFPPGFNCGF